MSEIEQAKALVQERLKAAVEDVFGIIENAIKVHEQNDSRSKSEIERPKHLLDVLLKADMQSQRAAPPQMFVCKEEVLPQQQERSPGLDQVDPEPLQIKEEQEEEAWSSQEEEQLQWLEEADTKDSIYTGTCVRPLCGQHPSPHLHRTAGHREGEPLPSASTEHMETEADGGGESQPTRDCRPLSSDCSVAESEDTDGDEDGRKSGGPQSGLNAKTSQTMQRHRSGVSSKGKNSRESAGEDAASCSVCGKGFSQLDGIQMYTHSGERPYSCKVCEKGFGRRQHVQDLTQTRTVEKPYSCGVCEKGFTRQDSVQDHMKTHTGERPYSCIVCGKGFSRHYNVQMHMKIHTGEKPYSCSVCGKGFIKFSNVQRHMTTHTGERPYSCVVCGKGFRRHQHVQDHMKTHTGERPHGCGVCGKGFTQTSHLKVHMKTHTGERPYSCGVCGKGFLKFANLQRHKRTHTGERPYSCVVCGKGFRRQDCVQNHMKTHTGEKP